MKRLWAAVALAPLSFAAVAHADDTISNGTSTPVATATATNGQPDNIVIGGGGSVTPKAAASGTTTAVTLNSSNSVVNNGSISFNNINNAVGILGVGGSIVSTGTTGANAGNSIDNAGSISLNESATQKNDSANGINEGPFATGTSRFGIQVIGTAPLVGTLTNSGSITVVGEGSAGIDIGVGGITGDLVDSGTITVTGDSLTQNGVATGTYGLHSAGLITGNVTITGALSATGQGATGVALDGGATGDVDINAAITVTGFHSLTPPVTVKQINSLLPSQLEAGGPAVSIGGSVGGGISVDAPIVATSTTAATTGGSITADGSTALQIGPSAGSMTIGPSSGANLAAGGAAAGVALNIGGTVSSAGTYQNFNATGIQIGSGVAGTGVVIGGGIDIAGSVTATTIAVPTTATTISAAAGMGTAIGLNILSGTTLQGGITVTGALTASSTSTINNAVTALQIGSGASGGVTLTNSGTIEASITGIAAVIGNTQAAGGTVGAATAISDQSGVITSINNTGQIAALITPIVPLQPETGKTVALDLTGNTAGVTVTQSMAQTIAATSSTSATTPAAPAITGDVMFGSGAANLNLWAGALTGAVAFGSGTNSLDLENGALLEGAVTQGSNGTLAVTVGASSPASIASTVGTIANTAATSTLDITSPTSLTLSSLKIGPTGQVIFTVDPANGAGGANGSAQFAVNGSATLAAGAKIGLNIVSVDPGVQTFTLVTTTGSLTSAQSSSALLGQSPFLFDTTLIEKTGAQGSVVATITPKTPTELGLNAAETSAFNAIFNQLKFDTEPNSANDTNGRDPAVTADILSKTNRQDFIHLYDQFLPDFEGGVFDTLVVGQEQLAQAEADTPLKLQTDEVRGWVQEIGYLDYRQDTSAANGYHAGGFGIVGGVEQARGDSAVGVSAAFITNGVRDDRQGPGADVTSTALEVGVYWRYGSPNDGLAMHASLNGGYVYLNNHRLVFDENNAGVVNLYREAKSQWNGGTATGEFGMSYQIPIGRFYIRPELIADYIYLYEGAFSEHGGGAGVDLAVASRNSSEASAQGDVVIGEDLGGVYHWRPEVTLGYRDVFSGGPGDTTARFISGGGPSFTLSPKFDDHGSLIARLGVRAGGAYADFSADAGGEYNKTYQVYDARAVARFLF
ncbi:MAG TPA: autotransporter domain-containing protein [Caulobacteraceae bacterium]|nr:autotransporter domain-containing protein [Caulobacteraceae bacterium]